MFGATKRGAIAGGSGTQNRLLDSAALMSRRNKTERVGVISLGCPKNRVDTEIMLGRLARQGHEIVRDLADADTVIVNTCGFIDEAKQESIERILEVAAQKRADRASSWSRAAW